MGEGFIITHYNPYKSKESTWMMYIDDAGKAQVEREGSKERLMGVEREGGLAMGEAMQGLCAEKPFYEVYTPQGIR